MGLGKHQGSHWRDYNTHISPWQHPFQRMTSRQDPVWGGIQWHFLSPLQTLRAYTVTVFTTSCQFMRIRCLHILSQHLLIGLRFSHIIAPDVWLVGIFREVTTQTEKDSGEVLWSRPFRKTAVHCPWLLFTLSSWRSEVACMATRCWMHCASAVGCYSE